MSRPRRRRDADAYPVTVPVLQCERGNPLECVCAPLVGICMEPAGGGLTRIPTRDPTKGRVEVITKDGKRYFH